MISQTGPDIEHSCQGLIPLGLFARLWYEWQIIEVSRKSVPGVGPNLAEQIEMIEFTACFDATPLGLEYSKKLLTKSILS